MKWRVNELIEGKVVEKLKQESLRIKDNPSIKTSAGVSVKKTSAGELNEIAVKNNLPLIKKDVVKAFVEVDDEKVKEVGKIVGKGFYIKTSKLEPRLMGKIKKVIRKEDTRNGRIPLSKSLEGYRFFENKNGLLVITHPNPSVIERIIKTIQRNRESGKKKF